MEEYYIGRVKLKICLTLFIHYIIHILTFVTNKPLPEHLVDNKKKIRINET